VGLAAKLSIAGGREVPEANAGGTAVRVAKLFDVMLQVIYVYVYIYVYIYIDRYVPFFS